MANVIATSANTPSARRVYYTTRGGGRENTRTSVVVVDAPTGLQGLAGFLAEHVYNTSNHRGALVVRVFDDSRSQQDIELDTVRRHARLDGWTWGASWHPRSGRCYPTRDEAEASCRDYCRTFGLDTMVLAIDDWLFPLIEAGESAESYWARAAAGIAATGATRVVVRNPMPFAPHPVSEYRIR